MLHYTKNAEDKIKLLKTSGLKIDKRIIENIVESPRKLEEKLKKIMIACNNLDKDKDLSVVYKEENGLKLVITIFPGTKKK